VSSLPLRVAVPFLAIPVMVLWNLAPTAAENPARFSLEPVFTRFNAPAPPVYRAFRKMEAGKPNSGKHGWLEVWTEYRPGQGFSYEVVREGGYEYVRNKVLRGVLEGEAKLIAGGQPLRAPIVPRNYLVEDGGVTESGLTRLLLTPARKSDGVIRGEALLEPASGGIVRMEGRLTKSPSFWTRDVDVVWKFTKIGDAIVPLELSSSARVIFYGRQPFKMTYEYESIEGRPIDGIALRASLRDDQ
jgi:hypothetical protein